MILAFGFWEIIKVPFGYVLEWLYNWTANYGLALILGFIGLKLVNHALHNNELPFINGGRPWEAVPEPSIGVSLGFIVVVVALTVVASALSSRRAAGAGRAAAR